MFLNRFDAVHECIADKQTKELMTLDKTKDKNKP